MSFWENVCDELSFQGITRKEFALMVGISPSLITKGVAMNSLPTAENAVKIAQALNVTVEYLVTGKNPLPQTSAPQLTDEEIHIYKQNSSLIKKLAQLSPASKKVIENLLEQMK